MIHGAGADVSDLTKQQRGVASVRCLEIVSEAVRRLPDTILERHPHIPWDERSTSRWIQLART